MTTIYERKFDRQSIIIPVVGKYKQTNIKNKNRKIFLTTKKHKTNIEYMEPDHDKAIK